ARSRSPLEAPMDQTTSRQTPPAADLSPPSPPDLLARRGWFATAVALGAALLTKLVSPDRAEAVPAMQLNQSNTTTTDTTLIGTLGVFGVAGGSYPPNALTVFGGDLLGPGTAQRGILVNGGDSVGGNTNGGFGLTAIGGHATGAGAAGVGVLGLGGTGAAMGEGGIGVQGITEAITNAGVFGVNTGAGPGVHGQNTGGPGVGILGISGASHGLFAASAAAGGFGGVGQNTGAGIGMGGISQSGVGVFGQNVNGARWAGAFFGANQNAPGLYVTGAFVVQGPKSGAVDTAHHGTRLLYAVESPERWFEDFGTARLEAGQALVPLEAIFRETVNADRWYHVFLTPRSAASRGLAVVEQGSDGFTVRELHGGRGSYEFDYRVVVKARGHEARRLERIEPPARPPIPEPPSFEPPPPPAITAPLRGPPAHAPPPPPPSPPPPPPPPA